jgi:hypothetical protein
MHKIIEKSKSDISRDKKRKKIIRLYENHLENI